VLIHQLSCGDLHVSEAPASGLHRLSDYVGQFSRLRSEFDLVLIDSPPVQRSYDGIIMAREVDTNLLLVEAEKTRSAVAQNLRDRILDAGGHISGVVLNKRRFHIPGFIYRRV
jgi:Mrp family chromosome partitioning ATPase